MVDELQALLTYVRFVLYPLLSLSLLVLAFCGKGGKRADAFWLHVALAIFFIAAGVVAATSMFAVAEDYATYRNTLLTPALFILVCVSWYTTLRCTHAWKNAAAQPILQKRSTDGTADNSRLVQVRRGC